MLFLYQAKTKEGEERKGTIEAPTPELALRALQRRDLVIISLAPVGEKKGFLKEISFFERVKYRDVVILSRQLATLFEAKVPVITSLEVLSQETSNKLLKKHLTEMLEDIRGGLPISQAMERHPEVFSDFYTNMVRVGEEAGKLDEIFTYLADYLERSYELSSKAKNALIYPAFVFGAFLIVMTVMLTIVIPKLSSILKETEQTIPFYTKLVIGFSDFVRSYGILFFIAFGLGLAFLWWYYLKTEKGRFLVAKVQISLPVFGELFRKIYLARLSDNLQTLLRGGVSMVKSLEITSATIGNPIYSQIVRESVEMVKAGSPLSEALSRYRDIPPLFTQMIRVGEETGRLDQILLSVSRFYQKEVNTAVDNLVSLIEPVIIVVLGLAVGLMVASILIPIYNMSAAI